MFMYVLSTYYKIRGGRDKTHKCERDVYYINDGENNVSIFRTRYFIR